MFSKQRELIPVNLKSQHSKSELFSLASSIVGERVYSILAERGKNPVICVVTDDVVTDAVTAT